MNGCPLEYQNLVRFLVQKAVPCCNILQEECSKFVFSYAERKTDHFHSLPFHLRNIMDQDCKLHPSSLCLSFIRLNFVYARILGTFFSLLSFQTSSVSFVPSGQETIYFRAKQYIQINMHKIQWVYEK